MNTAAQVSPTKTPAGPHKAKATKLEKRKLTDRKRRRCEEPRDGDASTKTLTSLVVADSSRVTAYEPLSSIKRKKRPEMAVTSNARSLQDEAHVKKKRRKKRKDRRTKNTHVVPKTTASGQNYQTCGARTHTATPSTDIGEFQVTSGEGAGLSNANAEENSTRGVDFPFPTDEDDHCESPRQAYAHIQPFLLDLQSRTNLQQYRHHPHQQPQQPAQLRIYDPYFCNGAVVDNLASLGFPHVYNKKEDCYRVWAADGTGTTSSSSSSCEYPDFDVLVTNPPYSGNHIERLLEHITSPKSRFARRPWFLLLPDWVHKKDFFQTLTKTHQMQPLYLVPKKRYIYLPPKQFRQSKKSDTHKKSSPFHSMWYMWSGSVECQDAWVRKFYDNKKQALLYPILSEDDDYNNNDSQQLQVTPLTSPLSEACDMARSRSALRDLRRKVKK